MLEHPFSFIHAQVPPPAPLCKKRRKEKYWGTQAPHLTSVSHLVVALGSRLSQAGPLPHLRCSPVGTRTWQRRVTALELQGAVGVIANTEDSELAANLAALVVYPAGPQCEVVAISIKAGRGMVVLYLLRGSKVLGG